MRRRDFITLVGGAAAFAPLRAPAQQPDRQRRVSLLLNYPEAFPDGQRRIAAFRDELRRLGWIEGANLQIDIRWGAGDVDVGLLHAQAQELVSLGPDVILANGNAAMDALQQQSFTGPIVFVVVVDPIGHGFVKSLAHPGGNITGFTIVEFEMDGKWLELLKEVAPQVTRVGVIGNPQTIPYGAHLHSVEAAAPALGVKVLAAPVHNAAELERAISKLEPNGGGGLIVLPDSSTLTLRDPIVALAARYRLPAIYPYRYFLGKDGLMSYGIDLVTQYRQAASYIDRILKGTKPADLPVQLPTKFELVLNLKTAKALGLTVPQALLATADEVIE